MSEQKIRWPNVCVGCNAKEDLKHYLYTRSKSIVTTPAGVEVKGNRPYFWVDSSLHLCQDCLRKAQIKYILLELITIFILISGFALIFTSEITDVGFLILGIFLGILGVFTIIWHTVTYYHLPNYFWKLKYKVHRPIFKFKNLNYAELFSATNPGIWVEEINFHKGAPIKGAKPPQIHVQEQHPPNPHSPSQVQETHPPQNPEKELIRFCPECGNEILPNLNICENCGYNLEVEE
ncbi:MAG: zinc ribbon domain-containing protein [Promethearchaeia archaeon]